MKNHYFAHFCVMEKAADLSDFDRSRITIAWSLGTSISKATRLVGCSGSTVVTTYEKWMTVKPAVNGMVLDTHTLSKKKVVGDCPAWGNKTGARQWFSWQTNTVQGQVEMYRSTLLSGHCWIWGYASRRPIHVPLLTKCHRQLRLRWVREHRDWIME